VKHEIGIEQPPYLVEDWPGKYGVFSWLEYVVTVPNPIFLVTTRKANGQPNANLHSWGLLVGERDNYTSLLALLRHTHSYDNILREGEWCLNFPSLDSYSQCIQTVHCTSLAADEITEAGFTVEAARTVAAPRIAEALVSIECRLEWERPLYENSQWHLFAGKVQHLAMDEAAMAATPEERLANMKLMYNVRSTVHPLTGEQYGPNTIAVLSQVLRMPPAT
jgi:flavin reductase (DIM6/NTAB) family NADH-FMN oxidoreductase RutF